MAKSIRENIAFWLPTSKTYIKIGIMGYAFSRSFIPLSPNKDGGEVPKRGEGPSRALNRGGNFLAKDRWLGFRNGMAGS
jgi:hypothetical protein